MKDLYFVFILLVGFQYANAQRIHFTDSSNIWVVGNINGGNGPTGGIYVDRPYKFGNDTIISGIRYKQMNGYYREDTVQQKVWARYTGRLLSINDTTEHLIYNGNWHIGDSVSYVYNNTHRSLHIISKDSTLINGNWYKVFQFYDSTHWNLAFSIIEGIGCTAGPDFPTNPTVFEDYYNLDCFSNKGITSPLNPPAAGPGRDSNYYSYNFKDNGDCTLYLQLSINDAKKNYQLLLYPNPTSDEANITFPSGMAGKLNVTDMTGHLVAEYQLSSISNILTIPVSGYAQGMYLVNYRSESGINLTTKLIVQ